MQGHAAFSSQLSSAIELVVPHKRAIRDKQRSRVAGNQLIRNVAMPCLNATVMRARSTTVGAVARSSVFVSCCR
jgi:hypothetical protein